MPECSLELGTTGRGRLGTPGYCSRFRIFISRAIAERFEKTTRGQAVSDDRMPARNFLRRT
jgi:hypothetical protein